MAAFVPTVLGKPGFPVVTGVPGPEENVLVASGAYTATAQQEFAVLGDAQVIAIDINTSAMAAASTTPTVEYFDVASQSWIVLLTGAAIAATGNVTLKFGPHATDVANLSANTALYARMRINMTHGNGNSHTYSISISAI